MDSGSGKTAVGWPCCSSRASCGGESGCNVVDDETEPSASDKADISGDSFRRAVAVV